jgi:hypothetical protein
MPVCIRILVLVVLVAALVWLDHSLLKVLVNVPTARLVLTVSWKLILALNVKLAVTSLIPTRNLVLTVLLAVCPSVWALSNVPLVCLAHSRTTLDFPAVLLAPKVPTKLILVRTNVICVPREPSMMSLVAKCARFVREVDSLIPKGSLTVTLAWLVLTRTWSK